jgi:hypothetical protein
VLAVLISSKASLWLADGIITLCPQLVVPLLVTTAVILD